MKISDKFKGKFLKTEDFDKEGKVFTVTTVIEDEIGGEDKLVMFFKETENGFPLNRTNAENLAEEFGDDTDEWEDQKVRIFRDTTMYQGKRTPCLRAKAE